MPRGGCRPSVLTGRRGRAWLRFSSHPCGRMPYSSRRRASVIVLGCDRSDVCDGGGGGGLLSAARHMYIGAARPGDESPRTPAGGRRVRVSGAGPGRAALVPVDGRVTDAGSGRWAAGCSRQPAPLTLLTGTVACVPDGGGSVRLSRPAGRLTRGPLQRPESQFHRRPPPGETAAFTACRSDTAPSARAGLSASAGSTRRAALTRTLAPLLPPVQRPRLSAAGVWSSDRPSARGRHGSGSKTHGSAHRQGLHNCARGARCREGHRGADRGGARRAPRGRGSGKNDGERSEGSAARQLGGRAAPQLSRRTPRTKQRRRRRRRPEVIRREGVGVRGGARVAPPRRQRLRQRAARSPASRPDGSVSSHFARPPDDSYLVGSTGALPAPPPPPPPPRPTAGLGSFTRRLYFWPAAAAARQA